MRYRNCAERQRNGHENEESTLVRQRREVPPLQVWRFRFDIRVILGAADLKFQIRSRDDVVLNTDYDAIQVRWDPPKQTPKEDEDDMAM